MAAASRARLPRDLQRRSTYDRKIGTIIEVQSSSEAGPIELQLMARGFQKGQSITGSEVFVKPKRLGPMEIFAIAFGLLIMIIPGVAYLIWWSCKPPEIVVIRQINSGRN